MNRSTPGLLPCGERENKRRGTRDPDLPHPPRGAVGHSSAPDAECSSLLFFLSWGKLMQHCSVQVLSSGARAGRGLGRPQEPSAVTQACICIPEGLCEAVHLPESRARLKAAWCLSRNTPAPPRSVQIPFSEDTPYPGAGLQAGSEGGATPPPGHRGPQQGGGWAGPHPQARGGTHHPHQVHRGDPTSARSTGTRGFRGNGRLGAVSHQAGSQS